MSAIVAVVFAPALLVCLVLFAGGQHDVYARASLLKPVGRKAAPAWTRPCWLSDAQAYNRGDCQRVRGRVIWVEGVDADGDGDRHLVLVARLRVHVIKLAEPLDVGRLPSIGSVVTATGPSFTGASRRTEIEARRVTISGRTTDRQAEP